MVIDPKLKCFLLAVSVFVVAACKAQRPIASEAQFADSGKSALLSGEYLKLPKTVGSSIREESSKPIQSLAFQPQRLVLTTSDNTTLASSRLTLNAEARRIDVTFEERSSGLVTQRCRYQFGFAQTQEHGLSLFHLGNRGSACLPQALGSGRQECQFCASFAGFYTKPPTMVTGSRSAGANSRLNEGLWNPSTDMVQLRRKPSAGLLAYTCEKQGREEYWCPNERFSGWKAACESKGAVTRCHPSNVFVPQKNGLLSLNNLAGVEFDPPPDTDVYLCMQTSRERVDCPNNPAVKVRCDQKYRWVHCPAPGASVSYPVKTISATQSRADSTGQTYICNSKQGYHQCRDGGKLVYCVGGSDPSSQRVSCR